jgi:hypothetical protein
MPNYLVELPESATVSNMGDGTKTMVIFAADEAGARRAAQGRYDGDGNALWASGVATVTELVAGLDLIDAGDENWTAYVRVSGGAAQTVDPIIANVDGKTRDFTSGNLGANRLHLDGALNDGGVATYVIDDILTAVGGTFTRAATFRVITVATGVITAIELVDPGEYSVLPATMTANPVSGGGGTGALVDLTQFAVNSYEALLAQLVTELAAFADLTPSLDLSEGALGARLFTVATIGDGIGDAALEFEIRHNGTAETVLVSTIVDEGIAAAVLTAAIPASPLAPPRIHVFK